MEERREWRRRVTEQRQEKKSSCVLPDGNARRASHSSCKKHQSSDKASSRCSTSALTTLPLDDGDILFLPTSSSRLNPSSNASEISTSFACVAPCTFRAFRNASSPATPVNTS